MSSRAKRDSEAQHDLEGSEYAAEVLRALPDGLCSAIAAGWRGLTLVEIRRRDGGDRFHPVLVAASPDARRLVASLAPVGVRVVREGDVVRMLVLAILDPAGAPLELGVDLAFPEGRALASEIARAGELALLVAGPGEGWARLGRAPLGAAAQQVMLLAFAEAGEWRTEEPAPLCDVPARAQELPRLALLSGGGVALQVPLRALARMSDRFGRADIRLDPLSSSSAIRITSAEELGDQADPLVLDLGRNDRALAAIAASQQSLVVLGVIPGDGRFLAQAEAPLSTRARRVLADAGSTDDG